MISHLAVVESLEIGQNVTISEFAIVRPGVRIENDVVIHPHVVIESGVVIGAGSEIFPGAYLGKQPKSPGTLARPLVFDRVVTIGRSVHIGPNAVIYYGVEIGDNSLVGDGASIREQCYIGAASVIGRNVTVNYQVRIGDRVKIMDLTWLAGNMHIGNDVFIAGGVMTANDNGLGVNGYTGEDIRGPDIRDGAKIGVGATLLPSVVIHEGAIVGAGSVVTRDVEPRTVVMGAPARYVRPTVHE